MGSTSYLGQARLAVRYVKERVPTGAANKWSDILESKGGSLLCVLGNRLSRDVAQLVGYRPQATKGKLDIEIIAYYTEETGCGNCMEQSAVAFTYLLRLGVRPLDWMQITNGDHAFVVVGRKSDSVDSDPESWGVDAAVCDPWYKAAYAASQIHSRLGKSSKYGSMLRAD
jgi:hypothetical protein